MKLDNLKQIISECCNDVIFVYNGLESGVTSEVHNSVPIFQVWHGTQVREYFSVDTLISDKFFSGKSIADLIGQVDFTFV